MDRVNHFVKFELFMLCKWFESEYVLNEVETMTYQPIDLIAHQISQRELCVWPSSRHIIKSSTGKFISDDVILIRWHFA